MNDMNPKVDFYFNKGKWQQELAQLRKVVLDCGLTEELKWGVPCYTFQQSNVVLIHTFKEYCALLFVKGALLKDTDGLLIRQTEQVQAARQVRFTDAGQVGQQAPALKRYIYEAIAIEEAGLKVPLKKTAEFVVPDEFKQQLRAIPGLKAAFEALTPGRQRAYLLHFAGAKQSATRNSRIAKCLPRIFEGKGLND